MFAAAREDRLDVMRFEGDNYDAWERQMLAALAAKGIRGFADDSVQFPLHPVEHPQEYGLVPPNFTKVPHDSFKQFVLVPRA
ncbi:MAG: hypothetical protein ACOYLU_07515, partial [Limisphaerales bacterium]